jgi:small subunit ribosomal protein S20
MPLDLARGALYVSGLVVRSRVFVAIVPVRILTRASPEVVVPRIKSAKKRMRQAKTHTALNRTQRSKLRRAVKKVRSAAGTETQTAYDEAVRLIDRAGRKRLIHPNAAARQKSRLAKLVKAAGKK